MTGRSTGLFTRLLLIVAAYWTFSMAIIFIHEAAHFVVARYNGVGVFKFQVGDGPTLFEYSSGACSYEFALYPLGGFNALAEDYSDSVPEEELAAFLQEFPEAEQYLDQPDSWLSNMSNEAKFLLAVAGVLSQIVIAIGMLAALWFTRHRWLLFPKYERVVDIPIVDEEDYIVGIRRVLVKGQSLNFWKAIVIWLFVSNLQLAISNTAPYPSLDGLHALRALAGMIHGDALTQDVFVHMAENALISFTIISTVFDITVLLCLMAMMIALLRAPKVTVLGEFDLAPPAGKEDDEDGQD